MWSTRCFISPARSTRSTLRASGWRRQVFGSKGWAEVGDVEHLTTWQLQVCYLDPANSFVRQRPQVMTFADISTERAELEHFARAIKAGQPLAVSGGDEVHNVAVLDAIVESACQGVPVSVST